jgi:hypothetical protein
VLTSAGEELVDEAPGRDAEHATVTTKSRSAAITRRIPRPYVVTSRRSIRSPERPSGSQDAYRPRIDSECGTVLLPRAHRGDSPRTTACRLSSALTGALPRLPAGSEGFLLARDLQCAGVTSTTDPTVGIVRGKETRDV